MPRQPTLNDIVLQLRETATSDELWLLMRSYFAGHGVDKASYHRYRSTSAKEGTELKHGVSVRAEGFPKAWVDHYVRAKLFVIDPIPAFARQSGQLFYWSEIETLTNLTTEQQQFVEALRDFRLGDGIAMHVYGPNMLNAYVGFGFPEGHKKLSAVKLTEFHCVAQMGHLRYCEIHAQETGRDAEITAREREILHWIARGKSNSVIAEILEISPNTVDTLVRRLFAKLDVSDRTSAAIRGVGGGLVLP